MKNWQITGFLSILAIGFLLISGCAQDNDKYCTDNFPGTYYDPSTKMCEHTSTPTPTPTPQIVYVTVTISPTPTPTPIPTINKNSVAYLNYQNDLREIEDLQTEFKIIQSNYLAEMQNAGRDVAWARALTIEYNKLKTEYEIRLEAAQARAAADLAEAEGK